MLVQVPDSVRRQMRPVEIPAYENFVVHDMLDESFNRVGGLWWREDGKWKLDPSRLPKCERFLVMLRGSIPPDALEQLVRIQPAVNRDQTEEIDRFWLDCMLRNVPLLEEIWQELNIDEVNVGVNVGIERCFSVTLPKELKERVDATRQLLAASRGREREEMERAWRRMRLATQTSKVSIEEILGVIRRLTSGEAFGSFLSADQPYQVGEIRREERYVGLFPVQMAVEASTELGLKKPTATGFLNFKKKAYTEEIRKSLDQLST